MPDGVVVWVAPFKSRHVRYTVRAAEAARREGECNERSVMKTMTCKQLGGACDEAFHARSFDDIAEMSKKHGMEMLQRGDAAHLEAMRTMKEMMGKDGALQEWFERKRREFESLPEDDVAL